MHLLAELDDRVVDIAFHEVWWADINETLTLCKQIRFWRWGLALPGIAPHRVPFLPGAAHMRLPANARILTWWNRLRIAYVSSLFVFSAFSIAVINLFLKRLDFDPILSTDTLVNYLSAAKLYSQAFVASGGSCRRGR